MWEEVVVNYFKVISAVHIEGMKNSKKNSRQKKKTWLLFKSICNTVP